MDAVGGGSVPSDYNIILDIQVTGGKVGSGRSGANCEITSGGSVIRHK